MPTETTAKEDRSPGEIPAAPWRVVAVTVLPGYRLRLRFRDGTEGVADLSRLVTAPDAGIYGALADPEMFAAVHLEIGVPCWPNGADLDPCWLYDEASAGREWRA